jgi:hypothetical protein
MKALRVPGSSSASRRSDLRATEQLPSRCVEPARDQHERVDRDRMLSALDGSVVRPVKLDFGGEPFLRSGGEILIDLTPQEVYDVIVALRARGKAVTNYPRRPARRMPSERDIEIFRLRMVERLTLKQTGEAVRVGHERIRQIMRAHYGIPMYRSYVLPRP